MTTTKIRTKPKRLTVAAQQKLLGIASAMSGVLYNMKQDSKVPEGWRKVAERWQEEWDAAR